MDFHLHTHRKTDGRTLWLYSRDPRAYQVTHDLDPLPTPPRPVRRLHPLRREPVYYNPGRNQRTLNPPPAYDPLAPVQPGAFPGEIPVTDFEVAVFHNRWPSLYDHFDDDIPAPERAYGRCEVVVYSTRATGSVGDLPVDHVALLLQAIGDRARKVMSDPLIDWIMPFENRGQFVGVTLPHPHGQLYGYRDTPDVVRRQAEAERAQGVLRRLQRRVPADNLVEGDPHTHTFCPPFGRYPYETWILPRHHVATPLDMTDDALMSLAAAFKRQVQRLDRLFEAPAPYVLWHAMAPRGFERDWPYHLQLWPMQRGPAKFKYLAAVEQISQLYLVDVMPEVATQELRALNV